MCSIHEDGPRLCVLIFIYPEQTGEPPSVFRSLWIQLLEQVRWTLNGILAYRRCDLNTVNSQARVGTLLFRVEKSLIARRLTKPGCCAWTQFTITKY